jgi:hypothetical protein
MWVATGREPFAHPGFGSLLGAGHDEPLAACWEDDDGCALLPLLLRSLPDNVATSMPPGAWRDAISPYGYGGPFVTGRPDLSAFWEAFLTWMRDTQVVTCFVRGSVVGAIHPEPAPVGVHPVHLADNVVVGLELSAEERWSRYEHKVRKNVNKARRNGLTTTVAEEFVDVAGFADVYASTMDRRSAAEFYRFDEGFFRRLGHTLAGSFWVADTRDEHGTLASTELVLVGERHCYSFLGGTRREAFPLAPNDLLKHDLIDHAAHAGLSAYVLGGGYAPGDGIFRYKRAFDPTGVVPFNGIQVVADQKSYDAACEAVGAPEGTFFPRYRAPVA